MKEILPTMAKKENKTKTLVLVDAHAIIHRAYHALPDSMTQDGTPTGALYGLSAFLLKLIKDINPDYLAACYDLAGPTFRHEVYEDYKGTRTKTDDALVEQLIKSREIFTAFNIPIYELEGFEADDLLGTIVEKTKKEKDLKVIIASGDMDTLQLVSGKRVQVYTLKKGINETVFYDEKAVEERFGFKPVLLPDWKGLRGDPSDNIIGIRGIGEKTATTLITNFGGIPAIYKALKKGEEEFLKAGLTKRQIALVREGKEEAEFSRILAEIRRDAPIIFSLDLWQGMVDLEKLKEVFNQYGFRSLIVRLPSIFSTTAEEVKEEIIEEDIDFEPLGVLAWVIDSSLTKPTPEDVLALAKTKTLKEAEIVLKERLKKEKLEFVYNNIELPLIPVLKKMNERGVLVNAKYLEKLSKEYHHELDKLEKEIWKEASMEFNINSPKQLSQVLFEKMELKIKNSKKTDGGAVSTRASELDKLKGVHPIIEKILSYREFQKLLSTYIDNLPELLGEDGKLHTHFLQTGAATGRLASQNPNLQNIPIKSELGRNIRHAFVASPGHKLIAFDYSQIELRIAAILSGDEKLITIFKKGEDVHSATARLIFNISPDKVTSEMRRRAKVINFGILYGMGVNALKQNLGSSREEAGRFYQSYFETFTGLATYLEKIKADAHKHGFTTTYFGRKRYFPGINSRLPHIAAAEERMAVNAPFQGTSADITKLAMVEVEKELQKEGLLDRVHVLLTIHDELIYEAENEVVKKVIPIITKAMESVLKESVPITVNVKEGSNWGEME